MKVDNFALTIFQTCPAKYQLRIKDGWTTRRKSGALGFGGALHAGLASWHSDRNIGKAVEAVIQHWDDSVPIDDYRTKEKCVQVMLEYAKHYPAESWSPVVGPSGPMIECAFTLDTGMYLDLCPKCGESQGNGSTSDECIYCHEALEPIEYGGIFDGLVDFSGQLFVLEHKSTSRLGSTYFHQFKPNNQVSGYIWAAQVLSGRRVHGAIINAIGVYKVGATKFERQPTSRNETDILKWKENVRQQCNLIQRAELLDEWPMSTQACTLYGLCEFHSVHSLSHETEQRKLLEMDYTTERWDFEKRAGTEVNFE
jgi:PD-(D/E)XK nuclease superfamily